MSGIRSSSPRAHRTEPCSAIIVSHGSPSSPAGPEADIRALAAQTARRLPGWNIRGATLAAGAAFDKLLEELSDSRILIYPFFMSDGWFVREELPRRVHSKQGKAPAILPPFGFDHGVVRLCEEAVTKSAHLYGVPPQDMSVLLVGHGSESRPQAFQSVARTAHCLASGKKFRQVRAGFLEGFPSITAVAHMRSPAVCLPLFTGRAAHVNKDLPRSLEAVAWMGRVLEPLGLWPGVPDVIARSLQKYQAVDSGLLRWDRIGSLQET